MSIYSVISDWMTAVLSPAEAKYLTCSLCVHTSSGAHPASYPMGTGWSFPRGKTPPGRDAGHSPHPLPRRRMSRSYTSSPSWLLGTVAGQVYFTLIWRMRHCVWCARFEVLTAMWAQIVVLTVAALCILLLSINVSEMHPASFFRAQQFRKSRSLRMTCLFQILKAQRYGGKRIIV
jgi:hypothetical protein